MKIFDSHIHYFGYSFDDFQNIIESSKYKDIFLGYKAISRKSLSIDEHIQKMSGGFVMPYCIKETNVNSANLHLLSFFQNIEVPEWYAVPFISWDLNKYVQFPRTIGMKEHFYLHNGFEWQNREDNYRYLNDHHLLLIIHSENLSRIDYLKFLATRYPEMYIQVAHLGSFRNCDAATKLVIDELAVFPRIYFDISTVFDPELIKYAQNKVNNRVLFGTDVPYISCDKTNEYLNMLASINFDSEQLSCVLYENARELVEKIIS